MRCSTLVAGLLSLASIGNCRSTVSTHHVEPMESLRGVPEGWKEMGAPEPSKRLHFRIAVHQPNHDLFEQTLMEISTPDHPRYGQHLKRDELKALIKPRAESTDAVLGWLKDSGVKADDIEDDGEWINFVASVSTAEKMMDTKFMIYQSLVRKDMTKIRTLQYSVPEELHEHIDMIQPTTRYGQIRPQSSHIIDKEIVPAEVAAEAVNASCNSQITPQCLKDLYNFADFKADPSAKVLLGVTGYLEEYARFKDLAQFETLFAPAAVGTNFTWTSVHGGQLDQRATNDSVEANLDIQYTVGLVSPGGVSTNFYSTAGRGLLVPDLDQPSEADNQNEPYLDFFTYLVGLPDGQLPQVLTTSYGEDEQSVPEEYSKKVCDMIGQLGTRGVSVLFSSGDTGVGSACQTNDGKNTTRFLPIFPAACPYVTSVGGTTNIPESAVSFSSGGFSDRWTRPSYQDAAVSAYLTKLGDKWKGLYNPQGRGFPDVAAQGTRFRVVDKGAQISVGGTSASAPTFASVVTLLNSARIKAGKPALGFLNPWIYSQGYQGLNDIKTGGSTGCTGRSTYSGLPAPYVPNASWNATEGWDPVTGYGTPDFGKLLKLTQGGSYSTLKA